MRTLNYYKLLSSGVELSKWVGTASQSGSPRVRTGLG